LVPGFGGAFPWCRLFCRPSSFSVLPDPLAGSGDDDVGIVGIGERRRRSSSDLAFLEARKTDPI
jgi:hypothetical protein